MRRPAAVLLLIALAASSCSSSDTGATTSTAAGPVPSEESTTTTTSLPPQAESGFAAFEDDGSTPLQTPGAALATAREAGGGRLGPQDAVDLFASTIGPVPGADPTRFEPRPEDGSLAIRAVLRVWPDLTSEQQEAIERALAPGSEAAATRDDPQLREVAQPTIDIGAAGARAQAELEAALGRPLTLDVTIETAPAGSLGAGPTGGMIRAWAHATRGGSVAPDGPADGCLIRVDQSVVTFSDLVHEYFHCFQYDAAANALDVYETPDWIVEGSAKWAEIRIAGPVDAAAEAWSTEWVLDTSSVFLLDYAAVGVFWIFEDMGADPWTFALDMIGLEGEEAVAASGLDPGAVLPRLATEKAEAFSIDPTFSVSDVWQLVAPDATGVGMRMAGVVSEGMPIDRSYTRKAWAPLYPGQVTFEGEGIVHIRVKADAGYVEFEDKDRDEVFLSFDKRYCLRPEGCTCGADDEVDSELPEASERLLITGIQRTPGETDFLIELEEEPDRFPDGQWEGTFQITTVRFGARGAVTTGVTRAAPFTITVADGAVTGEYAWIQDQRITLPNGGYAEGVGTLTGFFSGCAYLPVANPVSVTINGVADFNDGLGERPMSFTQAVGGVPTVRPWNFEVKTDDFVSGTIDAAPEIALMRASGLDFVDDVSITFEATRVA